MIEEDMIIAQNALTKLISTYRSFLDMQNIDDPIGDDPECWDSIGRDLDALSVTLCDESRNIRQHIKKMLDEWVEL